MAEHSIDARGLLCPMPVIRTQDKIATLVKGDVLLVYCSDPGASNDIPAWCRINGHTLVSIDEQQEEIIISIEVGE